MHKLGVATNVINIPIFGVNQTKSVINKQSTITLRSMFNKFEQKINFLVLENITSNIPIRSVDIQQLDIPQGLNLADPEFNISNKVDILLGADIFFKLICTGQIRLGPNQPILQKSLLGWIISGPVTSKDSFYSGAMLSNLAVNKEVQGLLERFWKIEECVSEKITEKILSKEEEECGTGFKTTFFRDISGRFNVELPIRGDIKELGDSIEIAEKRFLGLEKKLEKK